MPPSHRNVLLSAVLALGAGCAKHESMERPRTAVKVATVERLGAGQGTRYSAHIEPESRVDMAFKVGGYVERIAKTAGVDGKPRLLQEGDAIREGQELASVRKTDYVQRLDEARAAYDQAKAAVDQAERDQARVKKLVESGAVGDTQLEEARTHLKSARATMDGAKARQDEAATAVADTSLRAPMAGVVMKRRVDVGALAAPGTVAFSIADVSSAKAVFAVPDSTLPHLHLGATQTVTTDAYPNVTFQGRISRISPSADPKSLVFEAEVLLPNADGRLKVGMVAALALDAAEVASAAESPLVPLAAIVRAPGKTQAFGVFVVDTKDGAPLAHLREIELGEYLGRVIPVKKGLEGGETIVVLGSGLLSDGEAVEIIP